LGARQIEIARDDHAGARLMRSDAKGAADTGGRAGHDDNLIP
jgi:hypothetical protein